MCFRLLEDIIYRRGEGGIKMRITMSTTPQDVAQRTKSVMERDVIPNMLLKNAGKPNGFVSEKKDYQYWVRRVCGRTK